MKSRLTLVIEASLKQRLKMIAVREHRTVSEIVESLVEEWLKLRQKSKAIAK